MSEKKYKGFGDLLQKTNPEPVKNDGTLRALKLIPPREPVENKEQQTGPTPATPLAPLTPVKDQPVAPEKNFQKVPNSIVKEGIPSGLFKSGKNKELYDVLYLLTRGAIVPTRKIQISKSKLSQKAGIGSEVTLNSNLSHLQLVGLIKITLDDSGKHGGNIYEVFTLEEITNQHNNTPLTPLGGAIPLSPGQGGQKLPPVPPLETIPPETGSEPMNTGAISGSKTLYKTKEENIDDDSFAGAFGDFAAVLEEAIKKQTGKGFNPADKTKWKHVAEVLAAQIELIAARTTISNVPAVLAEHLQRHLNNKRVLEKMGLITPAEAREIKEPPTPKQEIPYLFLCPDCKGTSLWNKDGKGMRPGCPHERLEEAVERAKENGEI